MNEETNFHPHTPRELPPELEARIVAWVAGEASAFEAAELERVCAAQPAAALFKRRIEAVHGLVGEAERPLSESERATLQLAPEKRAKLLAVIGAEPASPAGGKGGKDAKIEVLSPRHRALPAWLKWSGVAGSAAAAALVIGLILSAPFSQPVRPDPSATALGPVPAPVAATPPLDLPTPPVEPLPAMRSAAQAEERQQAAAKVQRDLALAQRREEEGKAAAAAIVRAAPAANQAEASAEKNAGAGDVFLRDQAPEPIRETPGRTAQPSTGDIVKLDAFVVEGAREGSSRALAGSTLSANLAPSLALSPALKEQIAGDVLKKTEALSPSLAPPQAPFGDLKLGAGAAITGGVVTGASPAPAASAGAQTFGLDTRNIANESNVAPGRAEARGSGAAELRFSTTTGAITLNAAPGAAPTSAGGAISEMGSLAAGTRSDAAASWGYARSNAEKETTPRTLVGGGERLVDNSFVPTAPPAADKDSDVVQLSAFMVASDRDSSARSRVADAARAKAAKRAAEPDLPVARPPRVVDEALRAEVATSAQPVSTFSLHVSDVSYRLAREALARRQRPEAATIRPEEFYNAFDYGDPAPAAGEPVAARIEQAAHPFLPQRDLVRVALKVPAFGRGAGQPLRLTLLLDTSGSMEREDRVASVQRAIGVLASLLGPEDRVTLIGFARTPRLIADQLPGNRAAQLNDLVRALPAEGGTNLEEALKLAAERARAQFAPGAQNRIVLLTDGAANLGNADPAQLAAAIAALRQAGIAFDACGVGLNGLDDSVLEALTRQGDGRYYVIDSPAEADARFARQLAGAFRPAARDVKVQVRFNPARVRSYRLIGFEQHRLRPEDFRNDAVDAAELAAEEAATALYQLEALPEGEGDLGEVFVRFRRADTGEIVERSWPLLYLAQPPAFARATPSLQLAGTAALLAEKLRGGAPAAAIRLDELAPVVTHLRRVYAQDPRVRQFVDTFNQARRLVGD
jgi:secreted protein with Ig-like and vWFA domain